MASAAFGLADAEVEFVNEDGTSATQAGSHPFALTVAVRVNAVEDEGQEAPDGQLRDLLVKLPVGLVAHPTAMPRCAASDFLAAEGGEDCPLETVVGIAGVTASTSGPIATGSEDYRDPAPIYNLVPPAGSLARIGFFAAGEPVVADLRLASAPSDSLTVALSSLSQAMLLYSARLTIWGVPGDPNHDPDRGLCAFPEAGSAPCPSNSPEMPFLTLPRSCEGPAESRYEARSWQEPAKWITGLVLSPAFMGCEKLGFAPQINARLTSEHAGTPSGFELGLGFHDEGLLNPSGLAQSDTEELLVALPAGVELTPAAAQVGACTPAELSQETLEPEPDAGCPPASRIGTVAVQSPLLVDEIQGSIFAGEAPQDLYVVIRDAGLGILIVQVGELGADSFTGQLLVVFDQLPRLPYSSLEVSLDGAGEPLLQTPPECGEFATEAELVPWAAPSQVWLLESPFQIATGPGGGPCPSGEEPQGGDSDSTEGEASAPTTVTSPAAAAGTAPAATKRRCRRGFRRVHGKGRCVKRRCPRARQGRRSVRRCVRAKGRRRR